MISFIDKQKTLFKRKKDLIERITPSEAIFKKRLEDAKIRFMFQKGFIQGKNYVIVDFYIPKRKICIEIDGGYHNTESQIKRDRNKDFYLEKQRGFKVVRIKNEDVATFDLSLIFNQ